jgi:hypothetical protein
VGGFFGLQKTVSSGGGTIVSGLGARLAYASPAGGAVAAAPAGFAAGLGASGTGRLIVTLPSGNATWASLTAGADGQLLDVRNHDAANTLILPAAVFLGQTGLDLNLPPGARAFLYYDATDVAWEFVVP